MRKIYFLMLALFAAFFAHAQISGTKTIPGDYPTISAAVAALNTNGVGSGGVVFNVTAGHTESSADSIYLIATGTAADPIVFQKSGAGANPVVTRTGTGLLATSTLGGSGDAVILIEGSDYVTFDGINVATAASGIEYGYFLRKASATDGCKNITITNASVTMTKGTSAYVVGIYVSNNFRGQTLSSASGITVTSTGGRHENITLTKNTISNVFTGIICRGYAHSSPYDFYDQNITVGGASGDGNTIQNFAGNAAATAYGIYFIYANGVNASYNTVNNTAGGGTGATSILYGIFMSTGNNASFTASNNTVSITTSATASGTYGVYNNAASGAIVMNNNTVTLASTASSSGTFGYVYNGNAYISLQMTGNTIVGTTYSKTGNTYLLYNSNTTASTATIQNNQVSGTLSFTGASGSVYGYYDNASPTGIENISNNNFSNISVAGSTTFYGIYSNTSSAHTQNIFNNTISNITVGTGVSYMIYTASALNANVYGNLLHTLNSGGNINGLYISSGGGKFYNNKINDLASTAATGVVYGINIAGGNVSIYNNYIGNLSAANSTLTAPAPSIAGMYLNAGTANVYYNTVYLNATSAGANFGTAAVYTNTSANIVLRNNIFVNLSTANGTGKTIAHQRSGTSITSFGATSNNNDYYAGTPGANNLVYFDGTNSAQTLADYQTLVTPAENNSITENPVFLSTTGSAANFLHIDNTVATLLESGAINISGYTDDFDGDIRQGNPGYAGTGVKPDIGADEFNGIVTVVTDLSVETLVAPGTLGCDNNTAVNVIVRLRNSGTSVIDFSTTNATVSAAITGAGTYNPSFVVNTGTLAPGATLDVTLNPSFPTTTAGTYNITATAVMSGDASTINNSFTSSTVVAGNVAIPQAVNFTGYTGANLSTVFPNWYEATGAAAPSGTTSGWTNGSNLGGTGNVSAKINLFSAAKNDWIVSPKFVPTSITKLKYDVAITDYNSTAVDGSGGMQGTDDRVIVRISTDCGATWNDVLTYNAANTVSISNSLVSQEVNLAPYAGQKIIVAFFATDGPTDDSPDYDFHIDNINIADVLPTDVGALALSAPAAGCYSSAETITVAVKNYGSAPLDLSVNPVTVTVNVTGAATTTLTGTLNTGIVAPNGTIDVTMSTTLNMSAVGTYTFNAFTTMTGDATGTNDAMTAATRTVTASVTLPQAVDFTGFTGTNLTTVFPNWYEATGATMPSGTTSGWINTTNLGSGNVSAKINLYSTAKNDWIVGPKFPATANTKLKFDVAITDFNSSAADPSAMQGTDDRVIVRISTNCGISWTDLYTFDASNTTSISNSLVPQQIDLSTYAGQSLMIAFFATDGPVDNSPDYDFHIDNINITDVFPTDVGAIGLASPNAVSCFSAAEPVSITIKNFGTATLDFSVNPVTVTTNVTGAATATLTGTVNSGTLAPDATMTVLMTGTLNMSASGTYTFNASTSMAADPFAGNDAMAAATRTLVAPVTLPETVDFTGYTGANLTTLFPNWYEAQGTIAPTPASSNWTNASNLGGTGNVTARINLYINNRQDWLVGPKFTATALTALNFKVAITDNASLNADAAGMQGTDDKVIVRVSTDCGATWNDLYIFDASNTTTISNSLVSMSLPLGTYAGQNIIVAFYGTDGTVNDLPDYDFHIDDINIQDVPACTGATGGTISTTGATTFCGSGSVLISASGYSTGTGSTYQWQTSSDNVNWSDITGQTFPNSLSTGNLTDTAYFRLKVMCPSGTTTDYSNTLTVFVNPYPAVNITTANASICAGNSVNITVTGNADTYTWAPAAGLNTTTGTTVIATPSQHTLYTVTGSITASGCSVMDTVYIEVNPAINLTASATQDTICSGASTQLNATATQAVNPIRISEVTLFRTGTGATSPYPATVGTGSDLMEISNLSSSPYDISGYTLVDYANNSATPVHNYTFPAGTIIPGNSVVVLHLGSGTDNVANGFYNTGGSNDNWSSTSAAGFVLKIGTTIIDVVATGTSSNNYTFNAATGVTAAHWSGYVTVISGNAGVIRTAATDNNTASDWTAATASLLQTIGTYNTGYTLPVPVLTYAWSPATGLSNAAIANPVASPTASTTYTLTVTDPASGCSSTASVSITVDPATTITTQPVAQTVCSGTAASFSVAATGAGTLTYQWRLNGTNITGATSATLNIASVSAADAGNYDVIVTGSCGSVTSTAVALTIDAPTSITTQPVAQTVCPGSTATFTVAAAGGGTLTYQWRLNGTNITGATSATLNINNVAAGDAGNYDVVVTGNCGSVTSTAVSLTISANPVINTQPAAQAVCSGASASFTVAAAGTGLNYQWRLNGSNITGATNATYTIASVAAGDAGNYDVVITGTCGSVTSNVAALTLKAATSITTQPVAQTACASTNASFTVVAAGAGTITYQWRKDGTPITGATSSTLTLNNVTAGDAGNYDVIVTADCGNVTSAAVALTVNAATAITTQPVAQAACAGANVSFTVAATGTSLAYQWRKGGTNITGATTNTLTLNNITAADAANYDVVVTGTCGSVTSTAVALTLNAATTITTQPVAVTACQGNANFTVAATGSGTLTYQWRFNGTPIPGANTSTISVPVVSAAAGNYDVVVTGTCGAVTSNAVALTVQNCTSVPVVDVAITEAKLMPNAVHYNTLLRVKATRSATITWTVTDMQGREVMRFNQKVLAGQNDHQILAGELAGGMYQLNGYTSNGKVVSLRFTKL